MTTTDRPTLDGVARLARRLRPADQARFVAALTPALVAALDPPPAVTPVGTAAREVLDGVRAAFAAQGPVSPSMAEELAASRR